MTELRSAAREFLSHRRLAVAGVSRHGDAAANHIYRRMRALGYDVLPINPNAETVEGDACFASPAEIPGGVAGVIIATHPDVAEQVVRECIDAGVRRVWLHRSFGRGSVDAAATARAREAGLAVLDGGCPMMFMEPVDLGHRCIRWVLERTGKLPDGGAYHL
jgi:uncharacterized protein